MAASATAVEITWWQSADFTGRCRPVEVTTWVIAIGLQYLPRAATVA